MIVRKRTQALTTAFLSGRSVLVNRFTVLLMITSKSVIVDCKTVQKKRFKKHNNMNEERNEHSPKK